MGRFFCQTNFNNFNFQYVFINLITFNNLGDNINIDILVLNNILS